MAEDLLHDFLTPKEASAAIRRSEKTMACDRHYGRGPKWVRVGGRVYYRVSDLRDWIEAECRRSQMGEAAE